MKSLRQYIDLYRANRADIDAGSAAALNRLRPAALAALETYEGAPQAAAAYPELTTDAIFGPDYGLNLQRMSFPVDLNASFKCDVPNLSTLMAVVVNDIYRPAELLVRNLPSGVTVMSLAAAAREYPQLVEPYLGTLAAGSSPEAALNTLLCQDGVFIHLDAGVTLDKPVQIVNIFNSTVPLLAMRRLLIVAEAGSSVTVLECDHSQNADVSTLACQVSEIFAMPGARVEYYAIEESSPANTRVNRLFVSQQTHSSVRIHQSTLRAGVTSNNISVDLADQGCECFAGGIVTGGANQTISTRVLMQHRHGHCSSRQLFKYAMYDASRGEFGGKIIVHPGAAGTDAAQTNRNLLAGERARMAAEPQLEIYCDDVKCSHGAATGQLDSNALFYMETRGIPREEAQQMLTQAFMADAVDEVRCEPVRDRLRHLVERRLSGIDSSCASCTTDKQCAAQ